MNLAAIKAAAVLALLAALAIGVHLLLASERKQGALQCQTAQAQAAAAFNAATAASNAAQAAKTAKAVQDGQDQLNTVATAAGGALSALDRLRERAAADDQRRAVSCASGASAASYAAQAPGDMPAFVLGRVGEAARQLAAYADTARIAGQTCVSTVSSPP